MILSLRGIAEAGGNGLKITRTFSNNGIKAEGENSPQTIDQNYNPSGGFLSRIRIMNFNEPNWWNSWEFRISAGDNAWAGLAALQNYTKSKDVRLLKFAQERADFLMKLQDTDGGLRYGPKGQYHSSGDTEYFWKIKSTENNESSLYFFDMLYEATRDERYKRTADQIYNWLVTVMYDPDNHIFRRGVKYFNGKWNRDDKEFFAPDTTSWAPLERILNDRRFGATRLARLQEFEKIIQSTEILAGVYQGNVLKGISFSPQAKSQNVISIEWSSQFALRYWRMVQEYSYLKDQAKVNEYTQKYNSLIAQTGSYFKQLNGALVAPYAVFPNGQVAANIPTGHDWNTPNSYASVANVYYAFALAKFDPLILDRAMLGELPKLKDHRKKVAALAIIIGMTAAFGSIYHRISPFSFNELSHIESQSPKGVTYQGFINLMNLLESGQEIKGEQLVRLNLFLSNPFPYVPEEEETRFFDKIDNFLKDTKMFSTFSPDVSAKVMTLKSRLIYSFSGAPNSSQAWSKEFIDKKFSKSLGHIIELNLQEIRNLEKLNPKPVNNADLFPGINYAAFHLKRSELALEHIRAKEFEEAESDIYNSDSGINIPNEKPVDKVYRSFEYTYGSEQDFNNQIAVLKEAEKENAHRIPYDDISLIKHLRTLPENYRKFIKQSAIRHGIPEYLLVYGLMKGGYLARNYTLIEGEGLLSYRTGEKWIKDFPLPSFIDNYTPGPDISSFVGAMAGGKTVMGPFKMRAVWVQRYDGFKYLGIDAKKLSYRQISWDLLDPQYSIEAAASMFKGSIDWVEQARQAAIDGRKIDLKDFNKESNRERVFLAEHPETAQYIPDPKKLKGVEWTLWIYHPQADFLTGMVTAFGSNKILDRDFLTAMILAVRSGVADNKPGIITGASREQLQTLLKDPDSFIRDAANRTLNDHAMNAQQSKGIVARNTWGFINDGAQYFVYAGSEDKMTVLKPEKTQAETRAKIRSWVGPSVNIDQWVAGVDQGKQRGLRIRQNELKESKGVYPTQELTNVDYQEILSNGKVVKRRAARALVQPKAQYSLEDALVKLSREGNKEKIKAILSAKQLKLLKMKFGRMGYLIRPFH